MNLDNFLTPKRSIVWSALQEAIFASAGMGRHRQIRAKAGAAKTTTIVEDMNRAGGDSCFLAFNKAIAQELATRVSGATVMTLNAMGHRILTRKLPGAQLDSWRVSKRIRQLISPDQYKDHGSQLIRAISLAKSCAIFTPQVGDFAELIDAYDLEIPFDLIPGYSQICMRAWNDLEKNEETFDFDDQLFLPIKHRWTFPVFDHVYVDEAQDLSEIQHLMVQQLVDRGATLTAVGDPNQAIYGFRGATQDSMDQMQKLFNMELYPLSITYRCDKAIVAKAQEIVPDIEARPGAPDGEVLELEEYPKIESYSINDMIVCRNNAPIFDLALQFLKAGLPVRVFSNFLDTMEKFIDQFDARTTKDFRLRIDAWYKKEREACEKNNRWGRLAGIEDRYQTLRAFSDRFSTTGEMIQAIRMFANSKTGPRISTVHKAKGLESDRVHILRPDLMPSPRAQTPGAIQQERNLMYVGWTRARHSLIYLPREEQ